MRPTQIARRVAAGMPFYIDDKPTSSFAIGALLFGEVVELGAGGRLFEAVAEDDRQKEERKVV